MRILWADIVINTQNPSAHVRHLSTLASTSAVYGMIKSLSISGDAPDFEKADEADPGPELYQPSEFRSRRYIEGSRATRILNSSPVDLASVLPRMTQLKTFTFYLKNCGYDRSFSRRALQTVIENLPPSVENLGVDTRCCDSLRKDEKSHLCAAIADRMKTLRHLRVKLRTICPALIGQVNNLESGVILLQWSNGRSHTVPCGLYSDEAHLLGDHPPSMAHNIQSSIINTISSKLSSSATT